MVATDFGFEPYSLRVHLIKADADFIGTIRTSDASAFPAGAVVKLKFGTDTPIVWQATVTGSDAVWNVDKVSVAALLAAPLTGRQLPAHITYTDGAGVDLVWFSGSVVWHG
jgi:hypothetical protein